MIRVLVLKREVAVSLPRHHVSAIISSPRMISGSRWMWRAKDLESHCNDILSDKENGQSETQ